MIPKQCKRLAEVDFPVADVGRRSTQRKGGSSIAQDRRDF